MSVGHTQVPMQHERKMDSLLSALNGMNLTKRRLTPAQIANLESLRKIKLNNHARIQETKAEIERERERMLNLIP